MPPSLAAETMVNASVFETAPQAVDAINIFAPCIST